MSERLNVGDKVRVKAQPVPNYIESSYAGHEVTVIDVEDEFYRGDLTYYVEASDGEQMWAYDVNLDIAGALADKSKVVTLSAEQAAQVREALEAIGWDQDDLGPLAAPEPPKKVVKATITLPGDGSAQYALDNIKAEASQWSATIEFED